MIVFHLRIVPSLGAEEVEVGDAPNDDSSRNDPCGHLVYRVARDEGSEVGVVLESGDFALAPVAVRVVEVRKVFGEDGVAVFVSILGYLPDKLGLGGALHVEREGQKEPAQLLVYPGEVDQCPKSSPAYSRRGHLRRA